MRRRGLLAERGVEVDPVTIYRGQRDMQIDPVPHFGQLACTRIGARTAIGEDRQADSAIAAVIVLA